MRAKLNFQTKQATKCEEKRNYLRGMRYYKKT